MSAEIFTSRETHSRWIIYREHRTESGATNTLQASIQETVGRNPTKDDQRFLLDCLEPHFRPVTPDQNNPASMQLYEDHHELAKEYLKVQSELVMEEQKKQQFLEEERKENEEFQKQIQILQQEKESLLAARNMLQEESYRIRNHNANNREDGWVVINRSPESS